MFKYLDAITNYLFNSLKRHAFYLLVVLFIILVTNTIVNNFVPAAGEEHKWMVMYAVNSLFKVMLEMMLIFISIIIVTYTGLKLYKKIKKKDDEDINKTPSSSQY